MGRFHSMRVTYIYHSCYLIEFGSFSVIFDFYKDALREDGTAWVNHYLLGREEDLYVLCTHSHSDHFNPEILNWKEQKTNITYIFSHELLSSGKSAGADAVYLRKGELYRDHRIWLKAFGSTDEGGSFLLEWDNLRIFHAGDLNNWHWNQEVGKEEALTYENNFLCELELLAEQSERLDLAMFPVDPRLGADYMRGAEQLVTRIQTRYFLPMHFGEQYEKANRFSTVAERFGVICLPLTQPGQSYDLDWG